MRGVLKQKSGFLLVGILVFASVAVVILTTLVRGAVINIAVVNSAIDKEQAFHIAESGNDYYRWRLAHYSTDYYDGRGSTSSGPYLHQFTDKDGNPIGQFALTITPPGPGSTLVTILSQGTLTNGASTTRKVRTQLAIPSLARYAVATNDEVRFGEGTTVYGPIHSNEGIRFDGEAYNLVTSALTSYNDPDHTGNNEFAVHTHVVPPPGSGVYSGFVSAEASPSSVAQRSDVFHASRRFPVASIDFAGFTTDLSSMKAKAQASSTYYASSGARGYRVVLKTNGTFDLYRVNTLLSASSNCQDSRDSDPQGDTWGTWSIATAGSAQTLLGNYTIPNNNVIFLEDNAWIEGQISNRRVTIAVGRFPDNASNRPAITVNNDLLYTNYNGTDAIALVAQGEINAGLASEDDLRIDGALISQNGRIGRHYYNDDYCGSNSLRSTITLYGMLGSYNRYGFAFTSGTTIVSGYNTRNITYDGYFLYGPPPSFPLTSNEYQTITWEEIK